MKTLRLTATCSVLCILAILAFFTKSFWWFLEVKDWQAVLDAWSVGREQIATVCLWAGWHGVASIVLGTISLLMVDKKLLRSPAQCGLSLLICSVLIAVFLSVSDIGSGYWMLIDHGRYIPLCYVAFLQSFLIGYLLVILVVPQSMITGETQQSTLSLEPKACH